MFCIAILAAIVILILVAIVTRARTDEYVVKGMILNIISDSANREGAIALMTECNSRMLRLFDHLRKKYKIGTTDAECKDKCAEWMGEDIDSRGEDAFGLKHEFIDKGCEFVFGLQIMNRTDAEVDSFEILWSGNRIPV